MNKLKFGIDIDGTVTRPDSLIPFINESFQLSLTLQDITAYDLTPFVGVEEEVFADWFLENEAHIYEHSPLTDGAKETLHKFLQIGDLFFISARNTHLLSVTENWFKRNELHYHHIELLGTHDKISAVMKHQLDIFFEDKRDNAVDISEACDIPVILFDTPYNQGSIPRNVIRVDSWSTAEKWVARTFRVNL